ncbi:MAG: hypothetical protein V7L23_15935 [Nostoc sp.]
MSLTLVGWASRPPSPQSEQDAHSTILVQLWLMSDAYGGLRLRQNYPKKR